MSLSKMAENYHEQLLASQKGLDYFASYDITLKGIKEFQLGWIAEPERDSHEGLVNLPVFPYVTVDDRVIQIRFNVFPFEDTSNYRGGVLEHDFPLETPEVHLFNVRHALPGLRTNEVMLVSDVRSCIRLRQDGMRCVAAPGYENFYEPWYELFRESQVTLVFNEETRSHGQHMMRHFRRRGIRHQGVMLPRWGTVSDMLDAGSTVPDMALEYGVSIGEDSDE